MPLQKRIAFAAISKQTAKGAPNATPTFGLGLRGGGIIDAGLEQENDGITFASRVSGDSNRNGVNPAASLSTRLWPRSSGLLLYGALGGIVTTGAGPYTHTITPGATLPYLTYFGQLDTEYHEVDDCKINTLEITWDGRAPVECQATLMGCGASFYRASWTPTNDENGQTRFIPPGGTFKLDTDSATPVTAPVTGGRITINNNLVPVPLSASVTPDDVFEAEAMLEIELRVIPPATTFWRTIVTGADAGTTATGSVVYGSAEINYIIDASNDLKLTAPRVAWQAEYPDVDPAGGPVELTLTGRIHKPAGAAFTAVLKNAVVSY